MTVIMNVEKEIMVMKELGKCQVKTLPMGVDPRLMWEGLGMVKNRSGTVTSKSKLFVLLIMFLPYHSPSSLIVFHNIQEVSLPQWRLPNTPS